MVNRAGYDKRVFKKPSSGDADPWRQVDTEFTSWGRPWGVRWVGRGRCTHVMTGMSEEFSLSQREFRLIYSKVSGLDVFKTSPYKDAVNRLAERVRAAKKSDG